MPGRSAATRGCRWSGRSRISNRVLRGWGNYFRYGNSARKFAQIDCYVNERLAILASAKHGLQGRNWVTRFNYEWVNQLGIYRLTGTVKPTLAYASR
jgi:Group II intron, maturase-specific domain